MYSSTPLNIFIQKTKVRGTDGDDELAIVKAAAWAWYQHNAGSEGKLLREFDAIRRPQAPRPSKYKLEAMRILEETENGASQTLGTIHGTNSSLLDTHDIVSISKRLEYLIESSINPLCETSYVEDILQRQETWSSDSADSCTSTSSMKKRFNMNFLKDFWARPGIAACGRREDVDTRALLSSRRRQRTYSR